MNFGLSTDEAAFVTKMRAFFDTNFPEHDGQPFGEGIAGHSSMGGYMDEPYLTWLETEHGFNEKLLDAGLRGADWPIEFNGGGGSAVEQFLLLDELSYRHLPDGGPGVRTVARALIRFGTPDQQGEYLGRILTGEYTFALGWTEPDAGSDLSSLRTRAVRDGDEYVVSGQKVYTTYAQRSTHLWLAVRTGGSDSGNSGISILIAPSDTQGIEIRNLPVQGGERTNEVYLDRARVPVVNRVGEENRGWAVMSASTAYERMQGLGDVVRLIEILARWLNSLDGDASSAERRNASRQVAILVSDAELGRLLSTVTATHLDEGKTPIVEAAAAKVWLTELRLRVASVALELITTLEQGRAKDRVVRDCFEECYVYAPLRRFAGGTNQVLRDVIAQRGLGLPRV